jgi:hypothetical protein
MAMCRPVNGLIKIFLSYLVQRAADIVPFYFIVKFPAQQNALPMSSGGDGVK